MRPLIGIRRALGASARDVLALILRRTLRPVLIGAMIGVGAASAVSGLLASILFGVSPYDPIGLGAAVLLVLGVTLSAAVAAAGPTMTADPTAALRYE